MPALRTTLRIATGLSASTLALPTVAQDETLPDLPELPTVGDAVVPASKAPPLEVPMTPAEIRALPPEYQQLPVETETSTTTVSADGVETVTRTRRIVASAPPQPVEYAGASQTVSYAQPGYYPTSYAAAGAPIVLDRAAWLAECERRTRGRSDREKGGIIGGLLGALGGGIAGYEIAGAGERLGGTLLGAGVGGLAGLVLGNIIAGGGDKEDRYDCEGVLDTYLDQHSKYGARFAARSIPVQTVAVPASATPLAYPSYGYGYGYAQPPIYYQPQQTTAFIPVTTYQPQRVVVRETVREEMVPVPGATRTVPPAPTRVPQPAPSPKLIKQAPAPAPAPKMIKE